MYNNFAYKTQLENNVLNEKLIDKEEIIYITFNKILKIYNHEFHVLKTTAIIIEVMQ